MNEEKNNNTDISNHVPIVTGGAQGIGFSWLSTPENSFTTGAVFDLSGGRATY